MHSKNNRKIHQVVKFQKKIHKQGFLFPISAVISWVCAHKTHPLLFQNLVPLYMCSFLLYIGNHNDMLGTRNKFPSKHPFHSWVAQTCFKKKFSIWHKELEAGNILTQRWIHNHCFHFHNIVDMIFFYSQLKKFQLKILCFVLPFFTQ